ncbi:MAG: sortase, partial [Leptolinea sp.]
IYNESNLVVSNSTFYDNKSPEGGAILNYSFLGGRSSININNSTFSHNSTAIRNYVNGYGNNQTFGTVSLSNTIMANSIMGGNCENEVEKEGLALIKDEGNNLDSGITCGFNKGSISIFGKDPKLGTLQDNGGPTLTMALNSGSPAINKGNPINCTHRDQRGLAAVEVCDIGAFEYDAIPVITTTVGKNKVDLGNGILGDLLVVTVTNTFGNPLKGWHVYFSSPDGNFLSLMDSAGITDENGQASTTVVSNDASGAAHPVTVTSAGVQVGFSVNGSYSVPVTDFGSLYLPATGFAPGIITPLIAQSSEKAYQSIEEMQLVIPALDVNVPLVGVPQNEKGWDLQWLSNQAGYLEGTAFPTWAGNSAITGHVYNSNGLPGPFVNLKKLALGDQVIIHAWGQDYIYVVRSIEVVSPGTNRILNHEDAPWVTLITCQDYDPLQKSYLRRLSIRASFLEIR